MIRGYKIRLYPTKEQEQLIKKVKGKIEELHNELHTNMKILVTSDSRKFLNEIDKEEWSYTIPGKLVHMSYTPIHNFETHLKSFVDLLVLSEAEEFFEKIT